MSELPRVQARAQEEAHLRKEVDASLEEVKGERVVEADQSSSTMASLQEDTEKARAELKRLEELEIDETRALTQMKKETQETIDKQTRKADQGANELKRATAKHEALLQDIQNEVMRRSRRNSIWRSREWYGDVVRKDTDCAISSENGMEK